MGRYGLAVCIRCMSRVGRLCSRSVAPVPPWPKIRSLFITRIPAWRGWKNSSEDIVVKYRDPINNGAAGNGNEGDTRPSGDQGQKHGRGRKSSTGIFGGGRRNISSQEEDELATILTPEQIKRFEELNGKKSRGQAGANDK